MMLKIHNSPVFLCKNEKMHNFFAIAISLHIALFAFLLFQKNDTFQPVSFGVQFSVNSSRSQKEVVKQKKAEIIATNSKAKHGVEKNENTQDESDKASSSNSDDSAMVEYVIGSKDNPPPHYPEIAKENAMEGVSKICVTIGADGLVKFANICGSSGHGVLDRSALNAIKGWKFHITESGKELYNVSVKINFILK
jgi:TonB family protein